MDKTIKPSGKVYASAPPELSPSQAAVLIQEITRAIAVANAGFERPDPQQGAAALVNVTAMFLAAIEDPVTRKSYRKAMDRQLSIDIAHFRVEMKKGSNVTVSQ